MRRFSPLLRTVPFLIVGAALLACSQQEVSQEVPEEQATPPEQPVEDRALLNEEELVTPNVTYTGLLEEGGATIYQQGTHRLTLNDGKMVLLAPAPSVSVPLALYVGKLVRVRGDVRPTVEAGSTLMEVKNIEWMRREKNVEGEEVEVLRVLCGGASDGGGTCPAGFTCVLEEALGVCMEAEEQTSNTSSSASAEPEASSSSSSVSEEEAEEDTTSSSSVAVEAPNIDEGQASSSSAPATNDRVTQMAAEDIEAERWTQQYCSSHVGFCIPVHKNWYFKSFGALSSVLWHVEIGPETIEGLGDGPLVVELQSGDLGVLGVKDGDIREDHGIVTGYRSWSDKRYFTITADVALRASVSFITKDLRQGP